MPRSKRRRDEDQANATIKVTWSRAAGRPDPALALAPDAATDTPELALARRQSRFHAAVQFLVWHFTRLHTEALEFTRSFLLHMYADVQHAAAEAEASATLQQTRSGLAAAQVELQQAADDLQRVREMQQFTGLQWGALEVSKMVTVELRQLLVQAAEEAEGRLLRDHYAAHVVIVNEFRTSRVCFECGHMALQARLKPGMRRAHGVQVCNHCGTTWNRDVNSACNMLLLLVLQLLHGDDGRPEVFGGRPHADADADGGEQQQQQQQQQEEEDEDD